MRPWTLKIAQTQDAITSLEAQKRQQTQITNQDYVSDKVQEASRKFDAQVAGMQYQQQIQREQAASAELNRKVQEAEALNMDTDLLRDLKPKAKAQEEHLAALQNDYLQFQL